MTTERDEAFRKICRQLASMDHDAWDKIVIVMGDARKGMSTLTLTLDPVKDKKKKVGK